MLSPHKLRKLRAELGPDEPNRLGRAMELYPITQDVLSEKTGVAQSTISKAKTGDVIPSLPTIWKFTEFFGCTVEDLFPSKEAMSV